MTAQFLGIDFGWENKPSGLAALTWNGSALSLSELALETDPAAIVAWADAHAGTTAVVGIDAPIVIPNATGMRDCDKRMHSHYGKYDAGAYPASQARSYWSRTTGLSSELLARGFQHGDQLQPRGEGRYQIEVHPHAAVVQLFALDRIVKYKRGPLASRRAELGRLRALMLERLPRLTPALQLTELPEIPERGAALKAVEDRLDAITAAYIAAYWWYWGTERNDVIGDRASGYIIVPARYRAPLPLAQLRESYRRAGLLESDAHLDAIAQFEHWFTEAQAAGVKEANAMTVATADAAAHPSARIVLLKGLDPSGFVFYTNYESEKGRDLAANPHAALLFYWAELERQVRITGPVTKLTQEESEAYFHSRPAGSQLGAWASAQSTTITGRTVLEEKIEQLRTAYAGQPIPLPPYWGGYRVHPATIEFWQGRPDRLHDRLRYTREPNGAWRIERLSP